MQTRRVNVSTQYAWPRGDALTPSMTTPLTAAPSGTGASNPVELATRISDCCLVPILPYCEECDFTSS